MRYWTQNMSPLILEFLATSIKNSFATIFSTIQLPERSTKKNNSCFGHHQQQQERCRTSLRQTLKSKKTWLNKLTHQFSCYLSCDWFCQIWIRFDEHKWIIIKLPDLVWTSIVRGEVSLLVSFVWFLTFTSRSQSNKTSQIPVNVLMWM